MSWVIWFRQRTSSAAEDGALPPFVPFTVAASGATAGSSGGAGTPLAITTAATRHVRRQSVAAKVLIPFPARRLSSTASLAAVSSPAAANSGDDTGDGALGSDSGDWQSASRDKGHHRTGGTATPSATAAAAAAPPGPPKRVFIPTNKPRSVASLSVGSPAAAAASAAAAAIATSAATSYAKDMPKRNNIRRSIVGGTPPTPSGLTAAPKPFAASSDEQLPLP